MRIIFCKQCTRGTCPMRLMMKRNGDILTFYELVKHEDGSKERRVYGRVNEKTNELF